MKLFHVKQLNDNSLNPSPAISSMQNATFLKKEGHIVSPSVAPFKIVSRETICLDCLKVNDDYIVEAMEGMRETICLKNLMLSIFIAFLFMGLFDHYFWTLEQGQLTFWLVLGILSAVNNSK